MHCGYECPATAEMVSNTVTAIRGLFEKRVVRSDTIPHVLSNRADEFIQLSKTPYLLSVAEANIKD